MEAEIRRQNSSEDKMGMTTDLHQLENWELMLLGSGQVHSL